MMQQYKKVKQRYVVGMGEWIALEAPAELVCYGLGSCVGVFLYDKFKHIGGCAHVMTANNASDVTIIDRMVNTMLSLGTQQLTIRARLVGGADIMNIASYAIGKNNIAFVKKQLKNKGILIVSEDLGGKESRTARLNLQTGELSINTSELKKYTI